ncbi:MAG TPA: BatA domain-containing protein [Terriglobales bacterium]|nr:BatA domain-containing protein [Terriglobales bacterium]
MGFFAPFFLASLVALGAPLYLHLLRRQTTTPKPFSSLMFFEARTQSSMRHRRLRYLWLLALRLALLALLAFAFANPYILRPAGRALSQQRHLYVIDHSFSMQAGTRLADAQRQALATLRTVSSAPGQVAALGDRLEILTRPTSDADALKAAIGGVTPGFGHADFGLLARGIRALAAESPLPLTVHLYSDMQASNLPANFADLALPSNVSLNLHTVGAPAANWTIASIHAPDRLWGSPRETKPARIEATVAGFSTPSATASVSLLLNGQTFATQTVHVPASGRATAVFDSVVVPYGWTRGEIRLAPIPGDALASDNAGYFAIQRTDPERVLFVHSAGDARSPLYFTTALTADNPAFLVNSVSLGSAAGTNLSNYSLVVLSGLPSLPANFTSALTAFVTNGGGLLIAASPATQNLPFFSLRGSENFATQPATTAYPGWQTSRFFYAAQVSAAGARVLATLDDQTPLLLTKDVGQGHIVLFASGFDNLTNDLPLNPNFVAFIRETTHTLADRADTSPIVQLVNPRGQRQAAAGIWPIQSPDQGFYLLTLANRSQRLVAVNPDRRESDLAAIPTETLALWHSGNVSPQSSPGAAAAAPIPVSLWWYIMLLLLVAAVVESIVASRYLAVHREEELS